MAGYKSFFKKIDKISPTPAERLHFGNSNKTVLGGMCTLVAVAAFLFVAIFQFIQLYDNKTPYINTKSLPLVEDYSQVELRETLDNRDGLVLN